MHSSFQAIKQENTETVDSSQTTVDESMPEFEQEGQVFVGEGSKSEAHLIGLGLAEVTESQQDALNEAKEFALELSIRQVIQRQQLALQEKQAKGQQIAQALFVMCRVYVGSISFEVHENVIRQIFAVFGPIKNLTIQYDHQTGTHRGFGFVEYENPDAAQLAESTMEGKILGGRPLKIGRPSNIPAAAPYIEELRQEATKYHRIYIASIHSMLTETDIRRFFEAFGTIKNIRLAMKYGGVGHRGFGYIEFLTARAVDKAIAGMNGFDVGGGQFLYVGKCVVPPDALNFSVTNAQSALPTSALVAAAAITAKIEAQELAKKKSNGKESVRKASPTRIVTQPLASDVKVEPYYVKPKPVYTLPAPSVVIPQLASTINKEQSSGPPSLYPPSFKPPQSNVQSNTQSNTQANVQPGFNPFLQSFF